MHGSGVEAGRRRQVFELFEAALHQAPEERAKFLEEAGGATDVRREVERRIAAGERSTDFFDRALHPDLPAFEEEHEASMAGQRIGPYKLIRLLGQGGMGEVYLAGRVDDEFNQQVTIKLIKPGMDGEGILRRFRNERRILASLSHAHIARLLDGGTTDGGQPYFVMEYIEGEPIDEYCDREKRSVKERLELFCKVCSAVQYAHDLVVHRDIKPSNILVTAAGEPKLLDFGVAKLLHPELSDQTVGQTGIDMRRLMTPEYASPEQASGRQVTKATDVYSLGVLLFQLLAGRLPYYFRSRLPQEIERVICETEPVKPSTAVRREEVTGSGETLTPEKVSRLRRAKPDGLRRRLSGDLDNIVLMAMRKEPRRRYGDAAQLAEDIQRHLAGLPVIARPSTLGYRTAKYVRRNKLLVGFTTVLAFLTVLLSAQTYRLTTHAQHLDQERQRASKMLGFVRDAFRLVDPMEARIEGGTARQLVERASSKIRRQFSNEEDRASVMDMLGMVYLNLGGYDSAHLLLEEALRIRRERAQGEDRLDVAQSLLNLAVVLHHKNELEEAERLYSEALRIRRRLLDEKSPAVAKMQYFLALLLGDKDGDHTAAERLLRYALGLQRELPGSEHLDDVASTLHYLALSLGQQGKYAEAEPLLREALEIRSSRLGNEHPLTLDSSSRLVSHLASQGKLQEAEQRADRVLRLRIEKLGEDHLLVAHSRNQLATILRDQGKLPDAESLVSRALESEGVRRLGPEHPLPAFLLYNLATVKHLQGEYRSAETHYAKALETSRRTLPDGHLNISYPLLGLGRLLVDQLQAERALPLLLESLQIRKSWRVEGDWQIAESESALGACLVALKRFQEAEGLLTRSYSILSETFREDDPRVRTARHHSALLQSSRP